MFRHIFRGSAFAFALVLVTSVTRAETVAVAVFGAGEWETRAQCATHEQAVWVSALGRDFCMRYYLSTVGGEGAKPVVFFQGDNLEKDKTEDTSALVKFADGISNNVGTTGIYLARIGRDGSSGSHSMRHSELELAAINAALDAIKRKYGYEGFHLYGHSGGALIVGGLLALRSDIGCAVPADGRLAGTRKANLPDPALRDYNLIDRIPEILRHRSARILVITDPKDTDIKASEQTPFVDAFKVKGGRIEQFFVDSGSYDAKVHHFTTPFAAVAIRDCVKGASNDEIAADLDRLATNHAAAVARAAGAKINNPPTPAPGTVLDGVNLPGGDMANIWLDTAEPERCQEACRTNTKCAAWTYVRPGEQGTKARCWLKDHLPDQYRSACCVSGYEGARE